MVDADHGMLKKAIEDTLGSGDPTRVEVRIKSVSGDLWFELRVVRVSGLAGGCPKGDEVTLLSRAFPDAKQFAGVPTVVATVDAHDSYSVRVRIPAGRAPARYTIGARCGGGNFGVERTLTVLDP